MNLRTPRRRVSPRTKKRYRAIKNFLLRTLGSSSQIDNKINTSLTVSVSNLKQNIVGIEQKLDTVRKHYQDLAGLEYNLRSSRISTVLTDEENNAQSKKYIEAYPLRKVETRVLYKTPPDQCWKSTYTKSVSKVKLFDNENGDNVTSERKMEGQIHSYKERGRNKHNDGLDPIQKDEQTLRSRKNNPNLDIYKSSYPLKNFYSFNEPKTINRHQNPGCLEIHRHKKSYKRDYLDASYKLTKENNVHLIEQRYLDHKQKKYKNKHEHSELDQDFIANIIKRQYRPIKLFGRRESDFSQFSAPVCRDQEFSFRETVQEGSELCSCCHENHRRRIHTKYMCSNDCSDIRSICDTQLYGSQKHKKQSNHRKRYEDYNDSAMYDIIPVKEKSSPKSRRKFVEDSILMYEGHKEVPPSPRTQRPRLNLQAQLHTEDEDEGLNLKKRLRQNRQYKSRVQHDGDCSNISSDVFIHNRNGKLIQKPYVPNTLQSYDTHVVEAQRSLQNPLLVNDQCANNNDITLNTQTTDMSADKTDKTLGEIKDILQNFLLEIKKESLQSENMKSTTQTGIQNLNESQQQSNNRNAVSISGNSFNNNDSFGQCRPTFMPPLPNPCCYTILPVCPMNCMQNGFVVPSPSFTCATCANDSKERTCGTSNSPNKINSEATNGDTQKLIKEIHKLISQNPDTTQNKESFKSNSLTPIKNQKNYCDAKTLKTRSVGGSSEASKHDAKVGTPTMKCYSKSCEAIGSRIDTNTQKKVANTSYSDTVLEKGSSEEATTTQSTSESDYSSDETVVKKSRNKFTNILRSIGLLKKNKNADIEELSESNSSIKVAKTKARPPFEQHLINYNVHNQEYFQPPSMPSYPFHQRHHHNEYFNTAPYQNPRHSYSPTYAHNKMKESNGKTSHDQSMRSNCPSASPCANYYDPRFGNIAPQVPLCLKEIEVKSIGTQSIRKMSLLEKITNKMQISEQKRNQPSRKQSSTQTDKVKTGTNIFDWKKLQEKTMQNTANPMKFSYKTQKRLAEGDIKMRNVMLKKLFYKRNPFSPRNLLVRTLLGKDISSFGDPPKMYKPRMFI